MNVRAGERVAIMAKLCGPLLVLLASISLARGDATTGTSRRAPIESASQTIVSLVTQQPTVAPQTTSLASTNQQQSASGGQNSAQGKLEKATHKATSRARHKSSSQHKNARCDYLKEPWTECQSDGLQERKLRLKGGQAANCEPIKLIRRECRQGCKYKRGEWSSRCRKGVRTRIDTLLSGPSNTSSVVQVNELANSGQEACQAQRRVTKDCRRTCHYIRSAWSDCNPDGYRTRNLTLSDSAANCVQWRQTKRPCRKPDAKSTKLEQQTKVRPTKRRMPQNQATLTTGQVAPSTTGASTSA